MLGGQHCLVGDDVIKICSPRRARKAKVANLNGGRTLGRYQCSRILSKSVQINQHVDLKLTDDFGYLPVVFALNVDEAFERPAQPCLHPVFSRSDKRNGAKLEFGAVVGFQSSRYEMTD